MTLNTLINAYEIQFGISVGSWFGSWPNDSISLLLCENCALQFFYPSLPGDTAYYNLLSELYPEDRWEFDEAVSLISGGSVVDLGCGPGNFLRKVQGSARRVGNDLNPSLAPRLREVGVEPSIGPLAFLTEEFREEFDVATAFHVLEHLEHPNELFETARTILRPGGLLMVSVPNADRLIVDRGILPLDWPPHHLTRWTKKPLQLAAMAGGFSIEQVLFEPTHTCYQRLRHLPGPVAVPIAASIAYTRGGHVNWSTARRKGAWLRNGHALLGVFQRD